MGRNECGSNAMVTVQMTVEEYLEMKLMQEAKEVTTKQKNRPPSGDRFIVVAQEKAVQYRRSCRKSPPVPPFSKEMKSKNDPLGMSDLLSVMSDPIGHPSLTELLDELLRLRIFLVIHPHHLRNSVSNPRTCLRMTFDSPGTERLQLKMKFSGHPERPSFHLLLFRL